MQIILTPSTSREATLLDLLRRAGNDLVLRQSSRESLLCSMFGARGIHESSSLMAHGWERPADQEVESIVALLLTRQDRISILEIGAGSTWGTEQRNFGVPGLARIIKQALPTQTRVAVCDRAQGYDMFFHAQDGSLIRTHYSDDKPPKRLSPSPIGSDGTFIALAVPFIQASVLVDPPFAAWLRWHEQTHHVDLFDGSSPLFIRPKLDPEIEARFFGVRALSGSVDYLNLVETLSRAGERERYDLIFGRHLLPQYFPSQIEHLKRTMPEALLRCAHNAYIQFDRCFFANDDYADLVFRHHNYLA